jgi:hypothetical protein
MPPQSIERSFGFCGHISHATSFLERDFGDHGQRTANSPITTFDVMLMWAVYEASLWLP